MEAGHGVHATVTASAEVSLSLAAVESITHRPTGETKTVAAGRKIAASV